MGGECGTYGEKGNTYGFLVGKPGRKRTLGGPILDGKMILKELYS
jgi:hypothetical protein